MLEIGTGSGYQAAAAPDHVPEALLAQLAPGGRLCLPVGGSHQTQELLLLEKDAAGAVHTRRLESVRFVPMTGAAHQRGG